MSTLLESLNPAQKEAVLHAEGPLLIIAGAGTGKTKVITSKILYLIQEKQVPVSQILALTFTEKATAEMVDRVEASLPFSSEEPNIHTFHAFCDRILREKGIEIGIDPGYKLLDQTEQWLFLKKHLFDFELNHYRPLGNPSKFFFVLLNHFSRLKDEDISPESYVQYAEKLSAEARDDVTREVATKTLETSHAYEKYQSLMSQKGYLDFGDLQYYTLRLFEKRPSVLAHYQDRFQYLMVDEFQDTNLAQNKLVLMLSQTNQNLTVVGDDDQSIYKWRGASLSNILTFEQRFPECKKVVLSQNYRSSQNILDASYALIQNNNPYRLESQQNINKKLMGNDGNGVPVKIQHYSSYLDEAKSIVETIQKSVDEQTHYRDFAILVRTNQLAIPFVEALKDASIPFAVRDTQGLLSFEEVKDLLALLRFLVRPQDDVAFFRLLSLPIFALPMRDVLDLVGKAKNSNHEPLFFFLRKHLQKDSSQHSLPGLDATPFERVYDLFNALLDFTRQHTVSRTIGEFLDRSGYHKDLTKDDTLNNAEKIQHIAQFIELARKFESEENDVSVRSFLDYLELLEDALGVLSSLPAYDEDAVSILTVHSSKGLEFDTVFLPSVVAQRFPATNRSDPIEIPEALVTESLPSTDLHLQEERRLFYVACTRARNQLFVSYSDLYEGRKKWKPSPFIAEILQSNVCLEEDFASSSEALTQAAKLEAHIARPSDHEERLLFVPEVNVNQLSYSKISTFETCPLKYKFRYLFNIPSPSPHQANFGSSLHDTVHQFYVSLKEKKLEPTLDLLQQLFDQHWIAHGYESRAHEQARKKQGWEIMHRFFEHEKELRFQLPSHLEVLFRLKIAGLTFTGRIDRIDQLADGTYEVVDYKTGTYKKDAKLDKDLQLSLYALACKEYLRLPVSKLSLYFLEDSQKVSTTRKDEDLISLKEEMTRLSAELIKSDFKPTPGHHCGYCEYRVLCHAAV